MAMRPSRPDSPSVPRPEVALDPTLTTVAKAFYLTLLALGGEATYETMARSGFGGSTLQRACRPLEDRNVVDRVRLDNRTWIVRLIAIDPLPPTHAPTPCRQKNSTTRPPRRDIDRPNPCSRTVKCDQPGPSKCLQKNKTLPPRHGRPLPTDSRLVLDLIDQGVWASAARRLVREHDESFIRAWIEQAQLWGLALHNRGGWIRTALDAAWDLRLPVIATLSPEEVAERVAEAVWHSSAPEDKGEILYQAKAENGEVCRMARQVAGMCPQWKPGLDATIGVDYIRRTRLHTEAGVVSPIPVITTDREP